MVEMTAKISGRSVEYVDVSEEERYRYFDSIGVPRDYIEGINIEKAEPLLSGIDIYWTSYPPGSLYGKL